MDGGTRAPLPTPYMYCARCVFCGLCALRARSRVRGARVMVRGVTRRYMRRYYAASLSIVPSPNHAAILPLLLPFRPFLLRSPPSRRSVPAVTVPPVARSSSLRLTTAPARAVAAQPQRFALLLHRVVRCRFFAISLLPPPAAPRTTLVLPYPIPVALVVPSRCRTR